MGYYTPHPPPYWVFVLEYSSNILNKILKKILEIFEFFYHTTML
jgi:hypothetical protein